MFLRLLILLITVYSVCFAQFGCFDCNPRSPGNCEAPEKNGVSITNCTEVEEVTNNKIAPMTNLIRELNENSTELVFCYYLYFDAGIPEETGFYRGCSKNSNGVLRFCQALTTNLKNNRINGKMINCRCCSSANCNSGNFDVTNLKVLTTTNNAPTCHSVYYSCKIFSIVFVLYHLLELIFV